MSKPSSGASCRRTGVVALAAVVGAPAAVGLDVALPQPADAHVSSYCGHDQDGILWVTSFLHYHNINGNHIHHYQHFYYTGILHEEEKQCGFGK